MLPRILIMGAGITGSCLALRLEQDGCDVTLVDQARLPMTGASLNNEGKLHLGFVYAKDPWSATHPIMVEGSLSFLAVLSRLTGVTRGGIAPSRPFYYAIPRDSQVEVATVRNHFEDVSVTATRVSEEKGLTYLGAGPERWFRELTASEHELRFSPESTVGSFATVERSVNTASVARIVQQTVVASRVRWRPSTEVVAVDRRPIGPIRVHLQRQDGALDREDFDIVVNCLWHDRVRIDETAGVTPGQPWLHRYKACVWLQTLNRQELPGVSSVTFLLGPYGDVVDHGQGHYYVSWYPECRTGATNAPDARGLAKEAARLDGKDLVAATLTGLAHYLPAVAQLAHVPSSVRIGGGYIYSSGSSDISDPLSILHQRSDIGPQQYDRYITIDTGKYCTGPLFASQAARMIEDLL
jgi:glycine/D-amino acid oxidase-like deaminating enzyme